MATLADSLIVMGSRLNEIATDIPAQIQHLTTMVQALLAQSGTRVQVPQQPHQQHKQLQPHMFFQSNPTIAIGEPAFTFGSRQLRRNGTGSRSPRRDGDPGFDGDGIPELPANFTFDST